MEGSMPKALFVSVCLDSNLSKPLDYSVPEELRPLIQVGMRVEVPLRTQTQKGTVASLKTKPDFPNVKPIIRILSSKGELSDAQWKLAEWMSHYYAAPLQKVLRCFIPPHIRNDVKEKTRVFLSLLKNDAETLQACEALRAKSPLQAQILDALLQRKRGMFLSELLEELKISRSPVDGLLRKKWIAAQEIAASEDLLLEEDFFPTKPKVLNAEQTSCLSEIRTALQGNRFSSHLIYGVTGSGKTEIYLQAIEEALRLGKSAILLVPEISLTSQTIERFRARFSEKIAILHHRRSSGERTSAGEELREGKTRIVIGARSAIFCPIRNLGLIIVDEEHDSSYKQSDEIPCYQGRDVAVMRAHIENCAILLGSATPSIESRYNAEIGKYRLHTLRTRATAASLPRVKIVDMKQALEKTGGFTHFSPELLDAIQERVKAGEQTLLFLNRRGYHRMQICASCRAIAKCPHCDLSLTYHREANKLKCHLCDFTRETLRSCSSCGAADSLQFKGFGTEHVERSLHAVFPEIRTLRMDRDTTQKKNSHEDIFKQFRAHKADVLIGTQMIAKGFHFPAATLVGVLNIDSSLNIPDFRAPENVFQLLIQVAGRAGRSQLPGEVILQTFLPEHPVIRLAAAQDYDAFYKAEIEERKMFGYPPFCHLVKVLFSASDPEEARAAAEEARAQLISQVPSSVQILPTAPAGHPKIKDVYRFQFIIKTLKINNIKNPLSHLQNIGAKLDIDTTSTFF
jgi:primosomal protein N' (replication factor Y)